MLGVPREQGGERRNDDKDLQILIFRCLIPQIAIHRVRDSSRDLFFWAFFFVYFLSIFRIADDMATEKGANFHHRLLVFHCFPFLNQKGRDLAGLRAFYGPVCAQLLNVAQDLTLLHSIADFDHGAFTNLLTLDISTSPQNANLWS
jgi:hypothetical protein